MYVTTFELGVVNSENVRIQNGGNGEDRELPKLANFAIALYIQRQNVR